MPLNLALALSFMGHQEPDVIVQDDGGGPYIAFWGAGEPQPALAEIEAAWLDWYKQQKIDAFNERCEWEILNGFCSPSLGFHFGFSQYDQLNMTSQAGLLNIRPEIAEITWKTESHDIQTLTREQFFTVGLEAEQHKRRFIAQYWTKKYEILACATEAEVDAVAW